MDYETYNLFRDKFGFTRSEISRALRRDFRGFPYSKLIVCEQFGIGGF